MTTVEVFDCVVHRVCCSVFLRSLSPKSHRSGVKRIVIPTPDFHRDKLRVAEGSEMSAPPTLVRNARHRVPSTIRDIAIDRDPSGRVGMTMGGVGRSLRPFRVWGCLFPDWSVAPVFVGMNSVEGSRGIQLTLRSTPARHRTRSLDFGCTSLGTRRYADVEAESYGHFCST